MKRFLMLAVITLTMGSLRAQERLELIADVEGVHRQTGAASGSGTTYHPSFNNGGGLGLGLNWHVSGRVSLEVKAALLASDMRLRIVEGDSVANVNVGRVKMIPVTALVQWHPLEEGAVRPYIGAGVVEVFIQDIEADGLIPRTEFSNTTGFVVDAGLRVPLSKRWNITADARYVPVETSGAVRFGDQAIEGDLDVRPLIVSFGLAYEF